MFASCLTLRTCPALSLSLSFAGSHCRCTSGSRSVTCPPPPSPISRSLASTPTSPNAPVVTIPPPTAHLPSHPQRTMQMKNSLQQVSPLGMLLHVRPPPKVDVNSFVVNFEEEYEQLFASIPDSFKRLNDIKQIKEKIQLTHLSPKLQELLKKPRKKLTDLELEESFYCYSLIRDFDRSFVTYYDYKERGVIPPRLMTLLMFAHVSNKGDTVVVKTLYRDISETKYFAYDVLSCAVILKGLSLMGDVRHSLETYEKLYKHSHFPQLVHWMSLLKCSARAGDPKNFARFYYRLKRKNFELNKSLLRDLLNEWGENDDIAWKRSKDCNVQVHDYVYLVEIAQSIRNHKKAIQFVNDVFSLDFQPTVQIYEMFFRGINRDIAKFRPEIREWKLRFSRMHGPVDKPTIYAFNDLIERIKEHLASRKNNLERTVPDIMPKIKKGVNRKEIAASYGKIRNRTRYTSEFTDDSRLFEYVPDYLRRLEKNKEQKKEENEKENIKRAINEEIEQAKQREQNWNRMGFKGDSPVFEESLSGATAVPTSGTAAEAKAKRPKRRPTTRPTFLVEQFSELLKKLKEEEKDEQKKKEIEDVERRFTLERDLYHPESVFNTELPPELQAKLKQLVIKQNIKKLEE